VQGRNFFQQFSQLNTMQLTKISSHLKCIPQKVLADDELSKVNTLLLSCWSINSTENWST